MPPPDASGPTPGNLTAAIVSRQKAGLRACYPLDGQGHGGRRQTWPGRPVRELERPHQATANVLITGGPTMIEGRVEVRDRLGGLLKYYYREAA